MYVYILALDKNLFTPLTLSASLLCKEIALNIGNNS